jgi:hypothetical protein
MQAQLPSLLSEVAKRMISQLLPEGSGCGPGEVEALTTVCMMGVYRSGTEDPRSELRKVSTPVIEHLVKNLSKATGNRALQKVSQFFVMEWCWRNDYLEEDWLWEWSGKDEGRMHFRPRIPWQMIPIPTE